VHTVEDCNSNEPNLSGHKRFYDYHYEGLQYVSQNIISLLEIKDLANISQEGPKFFVQTFVNYWSMFSAQNCSRFTYFNLRVNFDLNKKRIPI